MIQPGTVMFASQDCQESVDEAKAYIRELGLTSEIVRLIRKDGQVLVIAKRMPETWRNK